MSARSFGDTRTGSESPLVGLVEIDLIRRRAELDQGAADLLDGDPGSVPLGWLVRRVEAKQRPALLDVLRRARPGTPIVTSQILVRGSGRRLSVFCKGRVSFDKAGAAVRMVVFLLDTAAIGSGAQGLRQADQRSLDPMDELADLIIAARLLVDQHDFATLRPLIDVLLLRIGFELNNRNPDNDDHSLN